MIEFLCTLAGIIAGVAVAASLLHIQGDRAKFSADSSGHNSEKIRGIADQLQMISHKVAANVSAHSEKVESFSGKIGLPEDADSAHLLTAIDDIIEANAAMQTQLDNAQKRIVQQSEMIEQASQQARTDALTGLANRRALDEFLTNCIASCDDDGTLGLLLMDIDHFKNFNDSFGHTTGDAVLASFARSISKACGPECYSARFGGEEFAVILNAESPTELSEKAASLRRYVSEQIISYEDLQLKITSSAGVCILRADDEIGSVYERADEGLYQSKKAGRNCGFWLNEGTWEPLPDVEGKPLRSAMKPSFKAAKKNEPSAADSETSDPRQSPKVGTLPDASEESDPTQEEQPPAAESKDSSADDANSTDANSTGEEELGADEERAEILDLNEFLGRLQPYLEQLRRAELPTAAFMVEAIGLSADDENGTPEDWDAVIGLVQLSLRGIDVVCLFRRHTLCIFMPGCSQDVALERAAQIQASLDNCRETWEGETCPDRLAISIASVEPNEESSQFLNRLEAALDEAQEATAHQVVIHDGESCSIQDV